MTPPASEPGPPPPAVISALPRELLPLLRRARVGARIRTTSGRFFHGRLGAPLILGWTGDGKRSAEAGLRSLLGRCATGPLVFLGVAGALASDLGLRQLVVATEVSDAAGAAPAPDPRRTAQALAAAEARAGTIYSSDRIVATADAKARLWDTLGRPAGAVVDLETATWARVAASRGLPYVAVRAVSDLAGVDLPLDFEKYRDRHGRVRSSAVALQAVWRPSLIGPLRRLQKQVDGCARQLATWAESYLGETCG